MRHELGRRHHGVLSTMRRTVAVTLSHNRKIVAPAARTPAPRVRHPPHPVHTRTSRYRRRTSVNACCADVRFVKPSSMPDGIRPPGPVVQRLNGQALQVGHACDGSIVDRRAPVATTCRPPARNVQRITEHLTQRIDQPLAAGGIKRTHFLQMAREMPLLHEIGDDGLHQHLAATAEPAGGVAKGRDLLLRNDEIPQPQARIQHLAERSCVKHALVAIQALERGQRAAVVAELAVVIVLDDPGPLLTAQSSKARRLGSDSATPSGL